jgi:DNA (cytosine-5)-methyltransferase 1
MEKFTAKYILEELCARYTNSDLAKKLEVNPKTIARWKLGENQPPKYIVPVLQNIFRFDRGMPKTSEFTFIDLFAGIGGIRMGFEANGGECVFTSEWDQFCQKTYIENFGNFHSLVGDIVPYAPDNIPDHDVLLAGFPCQPFSLAGVSKKKSLGRAHGFEDKTQGTLFFNVAQIIAKKRPAAFLLENVKNLKSHDKGNTFATIRDVLENELGYHVKWRVIDAKHFVPQHRERIIIVGFRDKTDFNFDSIILPSATKRLKDILHLENGKEKNIDNDRYIDSNGKVHKKYILSEKLWNYLKNYADKHRAKGNGFGFGLVKPDETSRTLSARYFKDGSEILIFRGKNKRPRRLTPRECARLMGFPDSYVIPVSDTQAYRQFGNSVVMPLIKTVAEHMKPYIINAKKSRKIIIKSSKVQA